MNQLKDKQAQIASLCAQFRVQRLRLFGSAVGGHFDPQKSDFDFLVEFSKSEDLDAFEQYFGLKGALESLLGRKVDLVDWYAARNPYFRALAEQEAELIYAA